MASPRFGRHRFRRARGRRARLGKTGADLHGGSRIRQPVHRRDRLGGSRRAELPRAGLRILGRRAYLPCEARRNRAWYLEVAERLRSGGYRVGREIRLLPGCRLDRSGDAGEPAAARLSPRHRQPTCARARRRRAVLRSARYRVVHRHEPLQVVRRQPGAPHRPHRRIQGLRALPQGPGIQLDQHDRGVSQLDDRWEALERRHERRGANHGPLGLARIRRQQRQEHGQRRRTAVCLSRQGPRLRKHVPRRGPHQPGVLPLHRSQDRLSERAGVRGVHRSGPERLQLVLEEVLPVARFLRPVHPVRLVALPGQQHRPQPDPPGHHQRDRRPRRVSESHRVRDAEVRAAALRHAALRQRQPFHARELGRRFLGDAAPDRQHARAQQLLVSDRDLPRASPTAGAQWRALLLGLHGRPLAGRRPRIPVRGSPGGTEKDDQFVRSSMYGSFLSGGFAGHVYGAEGIWGADIEDAAPIKMWDAFKWNSAAQMRYLREFAMSIGKRYRELEPNADLISPNNNAELRSHEGWAYCARTPDRNIFLAYFEKGAPRAQIRGAIPYATYRTQWFDPRKGTWQDAGNGTLRASAIGVVNLPNFPGDNDWGLRLAHEEAAAAPR